MEATTPLVSNVSDRQPRQQRLTAPQQRTAVRPFPALERQGSSTFSHDPADLGTGGCLKATILSAYDLKLREPPAAVTLTVGNETVSTGPPVQRHKDRNSFKFAKSSKSHNNAAATAASESCVRINTDKLQDLYSSQVKVELVYENQPTQTLTAEYRLNQLKLYETAWLVLHLEETTSHADGSSDAADGGTRPESTTTSSQYGDDDDEDEDDDVVPPTLRLQLTLQGPYRTEIAALVQICNSWFALVDLLDDNLQLLGKSLGSIVPIDPFSWDPKYILVPAAPILAVAAVSLPVVLGLLLFLLPMCLPVLVAAGTVLGAVAAAGGLLYGSTRTGRTQLQQALQPAAQTLLSTSSGQRLVYQTGPRPTPVKVAKVVLPKGIWGKLLVSLLIDAAGSSSYLLPIVGELADIGWAPLQTVLLMAMYDTTSPNLKYLSFVEEILPLTDIVPTATLGWLMEFAVPASLAQLGLSSAQLETAMTTTTTNDNNNKPAASLKAFLAAATTQARRRVSPERT